MTDPPDVVRTDTQFEIRIGDEVAFAEYRLQPGVIVFPHTVVPEAFAGQGVGGRLVQAGLAYAKEQGLLVKPTCSFFHAYIAKRPELHDLVHPSMRDGLKA
ncbi:GNAT family N-acetyltransferase [Phenylobacterium sp.]|uniref:GNAT family N-acetyltransferase n=1 Tax=Phenylobacterium sp. TaxID=1871053 RepID=UPI00286C522A|nr:GNAT family N-acetyltransferase [Phenylobacterium sp.]